MTNKTADVKVSFGEVPNQKEFIKSYTYKVFENSDDVLNELQSKEAATDLIDRLNSAYKTYAQVQARNSIMTEQAAPERAFEKQVKSFMETRKLANKPVTEDQARAFITRLNEMELS